MSRAAPAASRADQVDRLGEVDVDVVPLGRLGRRREDGLGQAVGQLEAGGHRRCRARCPTARTPHGPARPGTPARCIRSGASRPAAPARPGRPTPAGSGRRQHGLDLLGIGGQQGAGDDVGHLVAPEDGHGREHPALVDGWARAMITSKALTRSDATMSRRSLAGVVELADLSRVDLWQVDRSRRPASSTPAHQASAARASAKRSTWRRVRVRSKASSSCASVRVTSGSAVRTWRKCRRSAHAARASRWTMR